MSDSKQTGSTQIIIKYLEQRVSDLMIELSQRDSKIDNLECRLWKLTEGSDIPVRHTEKSKDRVVVKLEAEIKKIQRKAEKLQKELDAKDEMVKKILPLGEVATLFVEFLPVHNALSHLQNNPFALWSEDNVKQVVKSINEHINYPEPPTTSRTNQKSSCGNYQAKNQPSLQDYKSPKRIHAAPFPQSSRRPTVSLSQYTTDLLTKIVKSDLRQWGPPATNRSLSSSYSMRAPSRRFRLAG